MNKLLTLIQILAACLLSMGCDRENQRLDTVSPTSTADQQDAIVEFFGNEPSISSINDLEGKRVACVKGSIFPSITSNFVKNVTFVEHGANEISLYALRKKDVDAIIFDEPVAISVAQEFPTEFTCAFTFTSDNYAFALKKGSPLTAKINEVLLNIKKNGDLAYLISKWTGSNFTKQRPEEYPVKENYKNGILRVASDPSMQPMCFTDQNGNYQGVELDIFGRIAHELDMKLEFVPLTIKDTFDFINKGIVDIGGGALSVTDERKKSFDLTIPYYVGGASVLTRIPKNKTTSENSISSLNDLAGKNVACLYNASYKNIVIEKVQNAKIHEFSNHNGTVQAIRSKKADAVLLNEPLGRLLAARNPYEFLISCTEIEDNYGLPITKGSPFFEGVSAVIKEMEENGELALLANKWCSANFNQKILPDFPKSKSFTGTNGTLRVAASPSMEPMAYQSKDGEIVGLEIELLQNIAEKLDVHLEIVRADFSELIKMVASSEVDIACGAISISNSRQEIVDFPPSHYHGSLTILSRRPPGEANTITHISQLAGRNVGVVAGTTIEDAARKSIPDAIFNFYESNIDLALALKTGKIEAFVAELPVAKIFAQENPSFKVLPKPISFDEVAFFFNPKESTICDAFSEEIRILRASGELAELEEKWFSGNFRTNTIQVSQYDPQNGILNVATDPDNEPFAFINGTELSGFEYDLASLIASRLGYSLNPIILDESGYVDFIRNGKATFGFGAIAKTPERAKVVKFSETTYQCDLAVIVLKERLIGSGKETHSVVSTFIAKTKKSFYRTFVQEKRYLFILKGLSLTALITILSSLFGTILGICLAIPLLGKKQWCKTLIKGFITLIQGTPILILLMILYYLVFAKTNLDPVIVSIIGFSIYFSTYVTSMLQDGLSTIPKGQTEAALALGFTPFNSFAKVILPQLLRRILPVFRNDFTSLLQSTSVVGYIAVQDLTKMSDIIRSRTYEAFFPLITTAAIYFLTAYALSSFIIYLEHRLDPKIRKKARTGKEAKV